MIEGGSLPHQKTQIRAQGTETSFPLRNPIRNFKDCAPARLREKGGVLFRSTVSLLQQKGTKRTLGETADRRRAKASKKTAKRGKFQTSEEGEKEKGEGRDHETALQATLMKRFKKRTCATLKL